MELFRCKGIGPVFQRRLEKLKLYTFFDILIHLPLRYEDRTTVWPMGHLKEEAPCLVQGKVRSFSIEKRGTRKWIAVVLEDNTGTVFARWVYHISMQKKPFQVGEVLSCYGIARHLKEGWTLIQPDHQRGPCVQKETMETPVYTAVYPTVAGLSQKVLRSLVQEAFQWFQQQADLFPNALQAELGVSTFVEAVRTIHFRPLAHTHEPCLKRLIIEEYLAHMAALSYRRAEVYRSEALTTPKDYAARFEKGLPYVLTADQRRVTLEIWADLAKETPMVRLLQGDVGSGKTVVAAMAMLAALEAKGQSVLLVPTELLAEQHAQKIQEWFLPLGIKVATLTSSIASCERTSLLSEIQSGVPMVIVATHAVLDTAVAFGALRLVVIDEQHRFGVLQKNVLWDRGSLDKEGHYRPHQLMMTATPIPRSLAMAVSTEIAISTIATLPPGRTPVKTAVLSNTKRKEVMERITSVIQKGRQVYWVCPFIEQSEDSEVEAIHSVAALLQHALPERTLGILHGKLAIDQKEAVMRDFLQKKIEILVATTIIEVGVDVPNASVMVVENAERMGIAQLHQLRGRVGRGPFQSYCLFLVQAPLSKAAKERLAIVRESDDGFVLAERDLALRGPGEFLGTKQSGTWQFKIAHFQRDQGLFIQAKRCSNALSEHLKKELVKRWLGEEHHANIEYDSSCSGAGR